MKIAVTGHRLKSLGPYNSGIEDKLYTMAKDWLSSDIEKSIDVVITGMAIGWDQAIAKACRDLNINYWAAIPFYNQHIIWPQNVQDEYFNLLEHAKEVINTARCSNQFDNYTDYSPRKMYARNIWMIDNAELILGLYNGEPKGGTYQAFQYAQSKNKIIVNLWNTYLENYK